MIVDSQRIAPNCPRPCRSAAARCSSGEYRAVVQSLRGGGRAAACAVQHSVKGELADDPQDDPQVDQPAAV